MSDNIKTKKEKLRKGIIRIEGKLDHINKFGTPKADLNEPRRTEANQFSHWETKRLLLTTQMMVLDEIENTDKITKRALNVAWVSLVASVISLSATIIVYMPPPPT